MSRGGKKQKRKQKPKPNNHKRPLDPLARQKASSKHPGLLVDAFQAAEREGYFLLVESATATKNELWLFYDARGTGQHVFSYWPDARELSVGDQRRQVQSVFAAIRSVRKQS